MFRVSLRHVFSTLLVLGLALPAAAQGSSGTDGSSGHAGSSGSAGTSGSSGDGSSGTSGTSGSASGSSGAGSGSNCNGGSSGTDGSSGDGSSGSAGTSGSSGQDGDSAGTSGSSGSASGSSGSSSDHSGDCDGSGSSGGDGSSGDDSSGSAGTSGSSGAGSDGTSGSSGSQSGSSGSSGSDDCGDCRPSLPVITADCYTITDCDLRGVTNVFFDDREIFRDGAFGEGSWKIVDDRTIQVCPPLCLEPGCHTIKYYDSRGLLGSVRVGLHAPTGLTLVCQPTHKIGTTQCVFLHEGGTGKTLHYTIISWKRTPSIIPGIVSLDIGDNFTRYICGPGLRGTCVKDVIGVIPASLLGRTLYFQSIAVNPDNIVFPLQTSNVCETLYVAN